MDLLMAANNMAIPNQGIVTLPLITPIPMDHHNMVIPIIQATATDAKIIQSQAKPGKRSPKHQVGTDAGKAAALAIDESTGG